MTRYLFALGMLLAIFINPVAAQENLNLKQVISIAMEQSQEAKSISSDRALWLAQSYEIEQRQNLELEIDTVLLEKNASSGIRAQVTIPYTPSQGGKRRSFASAIDNVGDLELKMRFLALKHQITQVYLDLWLVQAHKAFLQENLEFAQRTQKIVINASQRGEVSKAVSSLLKAEVLKYEDELVELQSNEQSAKIQLFKLINRPLEQVELDRPLLSQLPESIDLKQYRFARELLEARLEAAKNRVSVAKKDASLPELSPRFFYDESFDNDSRIFGIGVRMQWPFSNANKAELTRAKAEQIHATESLAAYERLGYETLLKSALDQTKKMHARIQTYAQEITPAYQAGFKSVQQMFENGQASAIQLWQFHERLHEAEIKKLDIYQQAFTAEMTLESLMGAALTQGIQQGE